MASTGVCETSDRRATVAIAVPYALAAAPADGAPEPPNALHHGSPPVEVTASIQPNGLGGTQLAVKVRDHGPGLPAAAIPHVFDRFYKADNARARSEGSGLGLAIAWENARLHGGHLEAGNHPGGGAVFTVSLPTNGQPPVSGTMPQAVPAGL